MKFSISVHSDDGMPVDYSVNLLSAADAVSFINGWQAQQESAQQSVQRTASTSPRYLSEQNEPFDRSRLSPELRRR